MDIFDRVASKQQPPTVNPQHTHFASDGKGNRIGWNPETKKWEPVAPHN